MYNWILWFHIVSFVSWFAAIFYIPRLFVYHVENSDKKEFVEVVKIMEYKLLKYIGIPALWATVISGGILIYLSIEGNFNWFKSGGWLHAKLAFVVVLIAYFISLEFYRKKLSADACHASGKFFRFYNEIPTVLLLLIVALAVVKPF